MEDYVEWQSFYIHDIPLIIGNTGMDRSNMISFENIKSILVVCTGNICRSPMGEGAIRYKAKKAGLSQLYIHSAGTSGWDKHEPTSEAIKACSEIGIDISSQRSDPITVQMIQKADLTVAMETYHVDRMINHYDAPAEKIFLFGDFHVDYPGIEISDPYGMPLSYYRNILQIICQCSDGLIDKLMKI